MKKGKVKLIALSGGISALLGSIGSAFAIFGLCPCTIAPIFFSGGIISILIGFLSTNKIIFLTIGFVLLTISIIYQKNKSSCSVHKK